MKLVLQIMGSLGVVAFWIGAAIRLFDWGKILNASAEGWWRASMGLLTIGILFALIEILNELRSRGFTSNP
jgi:hypothetical protein